MTLLLEVEELRTSLATARGESMVVDGVTFSVGEGEAVALVGESGCGKTMTALSMLGLLPPGGRVLPGSSVRFDGEELVGAEPALLRRLRGRKVGLVFQEPATALNPVLPVGEQVAEGIRHHFAVTRREGWARAVALLDEVGLADPAGAARRFPHQLSGGMKQRVVIAMALACEPRLLVADEPATALDPTIQAQISDLLAGLRARRGLALLLITHDLGLVAELCSRVVVMYAGQVVETGGAAELLRRPVHPYTQGLLGCLPRLDDPSAPLVPIPGRVPEPSEMPAGCRFAPRCPRAWDLCSREAPGLFPAGSGGPGVSGRCWLLRSPDAADPRSTVDEDA